MLLVSDVHGAFSALERVAAMGERLLVLGDLINLSDYRTGEGITAEVLGIDFARRVATARAEGDYQGMRTLWRREIGDDPGRFREAFDRQVEVQYEQAGRALAVATEAYVTFGNVDRPDRLRAHLPERAKFVDADVVEIEGVRIGIVGGGISTPLGAAGEVTDEEMAAKLQSIGPVDVLCSHLPPAVSPLYMDVVTGRLERASVPILDYLREHQPRHHFFGDVHQPQASSWMVGKTRCRNVGYFRATGVPVRFEPVTDY